MLYYPQLASGSICQFPLKRRTNTRTVSNELAGGNSIRMSDAAGAMVRWQLDYSCLSDSEWASIKQLFEATEGRLQPFTFLDPADNLLMWSEDWTKPIWFTDPLLEIQTGIEDPFGGTGALQLTNAGQTVQRVFQSTGGPSGFQYSFSVYLRSAAPMSAQLLAIAGGQEMLATVPIGLTWTRALHAAKLSSTQDAISFGVQLPAGSRIEAFGAQVEPQPAAGSYKKTVDRAGVYPNTRFDSDVIAVTANGPNQNSLSVQLVSSLA